MSQNLPIHVQQTSGELPLRPEFELLAPERGGSSPMQSGDNATVSPALPLDRYASVCMQVREATIIASEDPAAFNHALKPAIFAQAKPQARKRQLVPKMGQLAVWICALQLGAIIWILTTGPLHIDASSFGRLRDSVWLAASPAISCLTHNGILELVPVGDAGSQPASSNVKVGNKKGKARHKTKAPSSKEQWPWPSVAGFVPPPPPAIPTSGLVVPPPPQAWSLMPKGPGAVGASTLPPSMVLAPEAAPTHAKKPAGQPAVVPTKNEKTVEAAATSKKTIDALQAASPADAFTRARATDELPLPLAQSLNETAPLPTDLSPPAVSSPSPAMSAPSPVVPAAINSSPSYTVISGNRKRIITDR